MRLVENKVEEFIQKPGIDGIYEAIASAARICYQTDASKMKLGPKEFVENVLLKNGHCYTGDSEVLTKNGWVKWNEYNGSDVAVVDPNTMEFIGFQKPLNVIRKTYTGTYYNYKEIGVEVTDGHRMYGTPQNEWVKNPNVGNYFFECNKTFVDNNRKHWTFGERPIRIPTNCAFDKSIQTNSYYEFIGFWLGDGSYGSKNTVRFHLKKQHKIDYLKQLCNKLGYNITINDSNNHYDVHSPNLCEIDLFFRKDGKKYIPIDFTDNTVIIFSIFKGLLMSDGICRKAKNSNAFCNTSDSIIEWCKAMGPLVGYNIIETKNIDTTRNITFRTRNTILLNDSRKPQSKVEVYSKTDNVYCVTVETGLIIIRGTSGQTILCGNCRPLEFGTVYLTVNDPIVEITESKTVHVITSSPYTKTILDKNILYITTNMRVIMQGEYKTDFEAYSNGYDKNYLAFMERFISEPTELHERRRTFNMIVSRGCADDFRTHITLSSICESTRFCNYAKDKFGNELTFIKPYWVENSLEESEIKQAMLDSEKNYMKLSETLQPQQLKRIFPLGVKAELRLCGYDDAWNNFFWRRCDSHADPECVLVANMIKGLFNN